MPEYANHKAMLYQNLMDAGCHKELLEHCILLDENKEDEELIKCLHTHRIVLLNNLHRIQSNIDCLDYLLYQIKKR